VHSKADEMASLILIWFKLRQEDINWPVLLMKLYCSKKDSRDNITRCHPNET